MKGIGRIGALTSVLALAVNWGIIIYWSRQCDPGATHLWKMLAVMLC
jgi:hypothetical protein